MKRHHDDVLWDYCRSLRREGKRIGCEAGLPGGRVDAVRLDARGRWLEIYELKTRAPAYPGILQLKRYGELADGNSALTLVVTPALASANLAAVAKAEGVRYEVFEGTQESFLNEPINGTWACLPRLHPASAEVARAKAKATRERREVAA